MYKQIKHYCIPALYSQLHVLNYQDLSKFVCKKTGGPCSTRCTSKSSSELVHIVTEEAQWFKPSTLQQLYEIFNRYKGKDIRLVFGGTGTGVYEQFYFKSLLYNSSGNLF